MSLLVDKSIFLAGLPATGKTYFGKWLAREKGYFHIDFEDGENIKRLGLEYEKKIMTTGGGPRPLFNKLLALTNPVVFNWGFFPEDLICIKQLFLYGLKPVWFTAPRAIACKIFTDRGDNPVNFEIQMERIEKHYKELMVAFGSCTISTMEDDGKFIDPQLIFETIFPSSA